MQKLKAQISKGFIFLSFVMICALDRPNHSGFWSHDTYMCEAEWGSQPCTKQQIKEARIAYEEEKKQTPTLKWPNMPICGRSFTLKQIGNRVCGVWAEGCSFGQVQMGYIVADQKGNKIIGKFGENINESTPKFPNQKYESTILQIDKNGNLKDYQTYKRENNAKKIDKNDLSLDENDNFYDQCFKGVDFK